MNYPDLTTFSPKMQAWEKLALVSGIARKLEAWGMKISHAHVWRKRAEIMACQPAQLWAVLDCIGAAPEAELRATYGEYPLKISGTVNGVEIYCCGSKADYETIEQMKKNKEARKEWTNP